MRRYLLIQTIWLLLLLTAVAAFCIPSVPYLPGAVSLLGLTLLVAGVFEVRLSLYVHNHNRLHTAEKVVALTFDDAPSVNTEKVLEILKEKNVPATFFCIGERAGAQPDLVRQMANDGHAVGSHSQRHTISYTFKSVRAVRNELREGAESMSHILNKEVRLFRLPFGISNPVIGYCVRQLHMVSIGWTVRSLDTRIGNADRLRHKIMRKVKPGAIILLHDYPPCTLTALPQLIDDLRQAGYQPVCLDNLAHC